MKGTWGRRVYGSVRRGPKYTRFHLEVELKNGTFAVRDVVEFNVDLDLYPKCYGFILDKMTAELDQQIKNRHQEWMRG